MGLSITSTGAATVTPVSSSETKAHLRVDHTDSDAYILSIIKAASQHVEGTLGRTLIDTQYSWTLEGFPHILYVPRPPLQTIDSIVYTDSNGTSTTWGSTHYSVDTGSHPGRVEPAWQETWPVVQNIQNPITITFTAGYGATSTSVPEPIKQGILMLIGHLYENRMDVVTGAPVFSMPQASDWLLSPYRVYHFDGY